MSTGGSQSRTAAPIASRSVRRLWSPATSTTVRVAAAGGIPKRSRAPWTTRTGTATLSSSASRLGEAAPCARRGGWSGNARHTTPIAAVASTVRHATRAPEERPRRRWAGPRAHPRAGGPRRRSTPRRAGVQAQASGVPRPDTAARRAPRSHPRSGPRRSPRRGPAPPRLPPAPCPSTRAARGASTGWRCARAGPCGVSISLLAPPDAVTRRLPAPRSRPPAGSAHRPPGRPWPPRARTPRRATGRRAAGRSRRTSPSGWAPRRTGARA